MPHSWLDVPHYKQESSYSCVAASVRMVLAYHGRPSSEEELRRLLGTQPDGTVTRHLARLATLDFSVQLTPSNLPQLKAALAAGTPPIVFLETAFLKYWQVRCAHVAVLVGMDETSVFLNDPGFDDYPKQVPLAEFLQAWAATEQFVAFLRPRP